MWLEPDSFSSFLLVGNFHWVWVSNSVGVVRQHLLWAIVCRRVKLWVLRVEVALGDDAAADGWLIVGLEINVVYVAFKLHGQRSGRPGVDKAWPITYLNKSIIFIEYSIQYFEDYNDLLLNIWIKTNKQKKLLLDSKVLDHLLRRDSLKSIL